MNNNYADLSSTKTYEENLQSVEHKIKTLENTILKNFSQSGSLGYIFFKTDEKYFTFNNNNNTITTYKDDRSVSETYNIVDNDIKEWTPYQGMYFISETENIQFIDPLVLNEGDLVVKHVPTTPGGVEVNFLIIQEAFGGYYKPTSFAGGKISFDKVSSSPPDTTIDFSELLKAGVLITRSVENWNSGSNRTISKSNNRIMGAEVFDQHWQRIVVDYKIDIAEGVSTIQLNSLHSAQQWKVVLYLASPGS